jgi:hypothetical protein
VLKDFRDVRGDALFGKRTFLVRHGRRWTCAFSAACWLAGSVVILGARGRTGALGAAWMVYLAIALGLLRALAADGGMRRDERLISAIAVTGRGMIVTLFAHLSMAAAGWSTQAAGAVMAGLVALFAGQAWTMARRGPRTTTTVPAAWSVAEERAVCPN